jgi:hypothetical protein
VTILTRIEDQKAFAHEHREGEAEPLRFYAVAVGRIWQKPDCRAGSIRECWIELYWAEDEDHAQEQAELQVPDDECEVVYRMWIEEAGTR